MTIRFLFPGLCLALAALGAPQGAVAQVSERVGLIAESERSTASADIAVDASGGLHGAYVHYEPDAEGAEAAYVTCAGPAESCGSLEAWTTVWLSQRTRDVQVAVTADGRPRLLITTNSPTQAGGIDYVYAACEAGCGLVGNWSLTTLATSWDNTMSSFLSDRLPQRTFVLDPAGRPMFLYSDRNYLVEPDHYGVFWMTCKAGCTDRANWTETDLARHTDYDTEIFDEPVLALDPQGRPRIATRLYGLALPGEPEPQEGLWYIACDAGCRDAANWRRAWIIDAGGGSYPSPTWDLAFDPQGRPRMAFFAGDGMEQADLSHSLIYLWCDAADCLSTDEVWNGNVVLGEGHGEMPALALDPQGRPRMAFRASSGEMVYAWCDTACETLEGTWTAELIEGQAELAAERPTALPYTCDGEVWEGLAPQLALTGEGRPFVAYDVSVEGRCLYQEVGEPEITYDFHQLWRGARLVTFTP